ncbi:cysteine-rich receptor-like protein kinase 4 [Durio zibethinus]|uniref:Cysteine-rich receptor-like protein kinase 4 n=1 Tax=Durio zibethinus TaxID=66656 RepID=A0A6P5WT43_DURZI|nr:cysteine-rich receptor-like protein kinase 4 [Durio zibethinus]
MKTLHPWLKLAAFCISSFFLFAFAIGSPAQDAADCVLNFTSYPYLPSANCIGKNGKVKLWGSIHSTHCCRNALNSFSQVLAARANDTLDGIIFLEEDSWRKCNSPFSSQESVSIDSCGFDDFYSGSSKCSSLFLSDIQGNAYYPEAVDICAKLSSSFDNSCKNCTDAIAKVVENLLELFKGQKNGTERTICNLAAVISVASTSVTDNSFGANLFSCMSSLDDFGPRYVKLKRSLAKALVAVFVAVVVLILTLVLVKFVASRKSQSESKRKLPKRIPSKDTTTWSGLYRFSKAEIENAISMNNKRKSLGRGSAGEVYEGILPSGQVVAIKQIKKENSSDSFTREVAGLSRIRHPNLVSLLGCCIEDDEQYLVLEYCPAGNLAQHLLRKDRVLTWERRVKILRDCALGLRYLHNYIDGCIVHRDIKLTNILLTEDLEPKLSDFGLARMLGMEESKVFTDIRGTIGYMDPEYMSNAKLSCASDIYSFGIVALQLLSGQKVFELDLDASEQLTRKAKDVSMGNRPLTDFEDPRLHGNLNKTDFEAILKIAVLCVAKSSRGRPPIDVVFDEMEKAWKNTVADMKMRQEIGPSATPQSRSMEVISTDTK